jgi:formylglycine-generating enzyme required for sulfatase activity
VNYDYKIGTKEVTNAQYVAFLNAVATEKSNSIAESLYYSGSTYASYYGITRIESGSNYSYSLKNTNYADMPVICVSFWDAVRFCNWLTTGETETGVYTLGGVVSPDTDITRNEDAWLAGGWALPNENEWYKAAYYNPLDGSYRDYPTASGGIGKDQANYKEDNETTSLMTGGTYSVNQNGLYDMAGNAFEWTEDIFISGEGSAQRRKVRGGAFNYDAPSFLYSTSFENLATDELYSIGFRVVAFSPAAVPEPGAVAGALGLATLAASVIWKRCRHHRIQPTE